MNKSGLVSTPRYWGRAGEFCCSSVLVFFTLIRGENSGSLKCCKKAQFSRTGWLATWVCVIVSVECCEFQNERRKSFNVRARRVWFKHHRARARETNNIQMVSGVKKTRDGIHQRARIISHGVRFSQKKDVKQSVDGWLVSSFIRYY